MDDLISRQFAIKELESGKDKKAKGEIGGFYNQIIENDIEKLKKLPSAQPIDIQEAYFRGKIDGIKECTARIKKVNEAFENG